MNFSISQVDNRLVPNLLLITVAAKDVGESK